VWTLGIRRNHRCGCGVPFRECPFWIAVFEAAFGGFDTPEVALLSRRFARSYRMRRALRFVPVIWQRVSKRHQALTQALDKLYLAIALVSKTRTVVDSSKSLRYASLLTQSESLRIRFVNIIRDPRGIVYSSTRRARYRDGSSKPQLDQFRGYRLPQILTKWILRNWLCRRQMHHHGGVRVLYESFVRNQRPLISAVAGYDQANYVASQLDSELPVRIIQHQIAGNWVRDLRISPQEAWRAELPAVVANCTALLSWPWRKGYSFEVFGAGERRDMKL
jgi:hypothetical protein